MKERRIAIYGAGGLGKEVRGMLELQGIHVAGFIDDFKPDIPSLEDETFDDVLIAVSDPAIRSQIIKNWSRKIVSFCSFVSEDVRIGRSVSIAKGCIICPGVKVTVGIALGQFVIVNLNATIGHDVVIGDCCSLMPSVNISGNVTLGARVFVGSGATVLQGLKVGNDVVIGAGAVVTRDVPDGVVVAGVPAKSTIR